MSVSSPVVMREATARTLIEASRRSRGRRRQLLEGAALRASTTGKTMDAATAIRIRQGRLAAEDAAASRHCPTALLDRFVDDRDGRVRITALRNSRCPPQALRRAARSREWTTRKAVAARPSCPDPLLRLLAADESVDVRAAVALNLQAGPFTLRRLSGDPSPQVRGAARAGLWTAAIRPDPR